MTDRLCINCHFEKVPINSLPCSDCDDKLSKWIKRLDMPPKKKELLEQRIEHLEFDFLRLEQKLNSLMESLIWRRKIK